jgi:hypothetical protein
LWEILPSHDSSRSPSWFFLLPFSNTLTERDQMHTPRTLMMCCWSGILLKCRFSFCTSGVRPGFCLVNKLLGDALLLVHRPVITLIRVVLSISHFPHTYIAKFYFSSWWILNRLSFLRIIALAPSGFFCLFVCLFSGTHDPRASAWWPHSFAIHRSFCPIWFSCLSRCWQPLLFLWSP